MNEANHKGKCPNCGGHTWIEETTWRWKTEGWRYTADAEGNLRQGEQIEQDGDCENTWNCANCGHTLKEADSWDECWEDDEKNGFGQG